MSQTVAINEGAESPSIEISANQSNNSNTSSNVTKPTTDSNAGGGGGCAGVSRSQRSENLRRDLAKRLDRRISDFGGSISIEWGDIKNFVESEINSGLSHAVKSDVEALIEHPHLRDLVRQLRVGRTDSETQADILDKMTSTMLPKVRRNHRQFLDRLNQQVSQMIVQLMRNDQLATVIDDEKVLHQLFLLAASDDEQTQSSQRT